MTMKGKQRKNMYLTGRSSPVRNFKAYNGTSGDTESQSAAGSSRKAIFVSGIDDTACAMQTG